MWITQLTTIVAISMVPLITSLETYTWLCIKLTGHVQILGEYHRSHRWGTPKNIETEWNQQPDKYRYPRREQHRLGQHRFELRRDGRGWKCIKWSIQHRLVFFEGCNLVRPLYRGILCSGAVIKWSNQHRLVFFFRDVNRSGGLGARPLLDGVRRHFLVCTWSQKISDSMWFVAISGEFLRQHHSEVVLVSFCLMAMATFTTTILIATAG